MTEYNKLIHNLEKLKLETFKNNLNTYLDLITAGEKTTLEALYELSDSELKFRDKRASHQMVKVSSFPFEKDINTFDFDFQPTINKEKVYDLLSLRFIENTENIIFLGPPGTGKTHLSVSIGIEAARNRISTYFISCHELIQNLKKAHQENRLDHRMKHYAKYKLLIIDEIGYLPLDTTGSNLLFQLIALRYEKKSTIVTTNLSFSKWGEIFGDNTIANAILDRLLHHSTLFKINGPSYRIKDKLKETKNS